MTVNMESNKISQSQIKGPFSGEKGPQYGNIEIKVEMIRWCFMTVNMESNKISQSQIKGPFSGEKGPQYGSRASHLFCYR